MENEQSRTEIRAKQAADEAHARTASRRRKAQQARVRRQLSQRTHWTAYVGVSMLALGVVALVAAALLTR